MAGAKPFSFLIYYFETASILNVGLLFEMFATEIVETPEDPDVIVSDDELEVREDVDVVRSCNFEKVISLIN